MNKYWRYFLYLFVSVSVLIIGFFLVLVSSPIGLNWTAGIIHYFYPALEIQATQGSLLNARLQQVRLQRKGIYVYAQAVRWHFTWKDLIVPKLSLDKIRLSGVTVRIDPSQFPRNEEKNRAAMTSLPLPISMPRIRLQRIQVRSPWANVSWDQMALGVQAQNNRVRLTHWHTKGLVVTVPTERKVVTRQEEKEAMKSLLARLPTRWQEFFSRPILQDYADVRIPWQLYMDDMRFRNTTVKTDSVVRIAQFDLQASWVDNVATIQNFRTQLLGLQAKLRGQMSLTKNWPVDLHAQVHYAKDDIDAKSSIDIQGDLKEEVRLTMRPTMQSPIPVQAKIEGDAQFGVVGLPLTLFIQVSDWQWQGKTVKDFQLALMGDALRYRLQGKGDFVWDENWNGSIRIGGRGNTQRMKLNRLALRTNQGKVVLKGEVGWDKEITWVANVLINEFRAKEKTLLSVPLDLDGKVETKGSWNPDAWRAHMTNLDISGSIAKAPLALKADLHALSTGVLWTQSLEVKAGINSVHLVGGLRPAGRVDGARNPIFELTGRFHAPDFSRAYPEIAGSLRGKLRLAGTWRQPTAQGTLFAKNWRYKDFSLARIDVVSNIEGNKVVQGGLSIVLDSVRGPGFFFPRVTIGLEGNRKKHSLIVSWRGDPVRNQLEVTGRWDQRSDRWSGTIQSWKLDSDYGALQVVKPFNIDVLLPQHEVRVASHCWKMDADRLCLRKNWTLDWEKQTASRLQWRWSNFPLTYLHRWMNDDVRLVGVAQMDAQVDFPKGLQNFPIIQANLTGKKWQNFIKMYDGEKEITVENLRLVMKAQENLWSVSFDGALQGKENWHTDLQVHNPMTDKTLSGQVQVPQLDLGIANPFLPFGDKVFGSLHTSLKIAGSVDKPELWGDFFIDNLKIESLKLPVTMLPSDIRIRSMGLRSRLESNLLTTDGEVKVVGDASWPDVFVSVRASTKDLGLTVPPMVTLRTHFDVSAGLDEKSLRLGGRVYIPKAKVTVNELPEQVVSKSSDRIRLDRPGSWKKQTGKALETHSDLRIIIGKEVYIDAMGLKTRVRGPLHVQQLRSGSLGLTGQIDIVDGTFKAYGQDLIVRKGQLLFAGLPTNPGIFMEVIRNPERTADDVRVGIRVEGTATRPKVTLFSEPAMGQEELLSYLLRGEALDPSGETDNSAITAAVLGLGLSQGTGVVQGIGDVIGLEDLSVDTEGAGDSSQVVVSAYVLPGLRVKYGIGLFDSLATITLRYRLMPKVYVRAISGVDQAIDILYRVDFDHPREIWKLLWE